MYLIDCLDKEELLKSSLSLVEDNYILIEGDILKGHLSLDVGDIWILLSVSPSPEDRGVLRIHHNYLPVFCSSECKGYEDLVGEIIIAMSLE